MKQRLLAYGQLLRLSLAPTVVADLAAGVALAVAAPGGAPRLLPLVPISLLLFCGGMALNAFVDRVEDATTRPQRPLPSGTIAPAAALFLAIAFLVGGPALALVLLPSSTDGPRVAAALALCIAAYHSPLRRNGVVGPLLLGLIRGGNLALGAVAIVGLRLGLAAALPFAACHVAYVIGASLVAHEEDRAPRIRRIRFGVVLSFAAVAASALLALFMFDSASIALFVAIWQLYSLRRALLLFRPGAPGAVPIAAFARLLLSRLPMIPAVAAFAVGANDLGLLAIGMFWLVFIAVRFIPPT
ncbi:MAG: hypothetical protein EXS13_10295 [Planctomycetes bacterium]|nr:hypothetical protein [Planctomycetota bacterium]